ncbi:hypothetical protein SAMN05192534_11556 [Alteribacillus persepolensis]|uniref:Probable membrane transporter protein n=1 Tax=Alteribacillus persepolensis TaxID=568899 RepID=A0A1G8GEH7_9BACI|nr:sulfite exporter TauE/SafE family protein [Alteribacillus persepolensis]SDH92750.1 hypothetical protein SAMN05192534_11556 [Alteribacillus persepolensis]
MLIDLLVVSLVLFLGSFLQGASGFGFGLFAMSFLPFLFTVKDSTLLVVSLALITSLSIFMKVYKHIHIQTLLYLLAAAVVGRLGAFFILHNFGDMDVLKKLLGFVLIAMVVYIFMPKGSEEKRQKSSVLPLVLGFLGGFIGGLFVVGGPFFVFYFLIACKDKYAYTANLQAAFVVSNVVTVVMHGVSGDFNIDFIYYFLIGVVSVLLGTRFGMMWLEKLSQEHVKRIAGIIVGISGVNLILFS